MKKNYNLYKSLVSRFKSEDVYKIYWSSNKFLAGKSWDNFGDAIVPLLVEKISGKKVCWTPKAGEISKLSKREKVYFVIGSILEQARENNIVWGAGIINSDAKLKKSSFLAVRGPISYSRVLASGQKMKKVWGDPALLCPFYFPVPKKTQRNINTLIPHYVDYEQVNTKFNYKNGTEILDLKCSDIELVIEKIATSQLVFSSSLHGLIVAHAYGVKAVWVQFSDKLDGDDIKFNDYFLSVGISLYKPFVYTEKLKDQRFPDAISLPDREILHKVQLDLIECCPFKNN
ncbi:polysaccharide pyruvyl transferase family protein [Salegentibacter flavus]|uniref:Polysaccharide pyruvyl transferase n=1 Tax=Salegentibacter flavus TaxID=287099 RepID=A0A1I4Y4L7_9FLAO|nr:polysaccharide pyruvyl transferase family protein [Salegentibacter flavus]SFN33024.1 Polysaccharide pyruvyl transferase [Salegentibacter flavus]